VKIRWKAAGSVRFVFLFLLLLLVAFPRAAWGRLFAGYASLKEVEARLRMRAEVETRTGRITLSDGRNHVTLVPGMQQMRVNGTFRRLEQRVAYRSGEVVIPETALRLIRGLLGKKEAAKRAEPKPSSVASEVRKIRPPRLGKVLIDPGHGGCFPGAVGPRGLKEKDVVLRIALRLRQLLAERGVEVHLTRTTDRHFSSNLNRDLNCRVDRANRMSPDLFVSIHANASDSPGVSGFEVFYVYARDWGRRVARASRYYGRRPDLLGRKGPLSRSSRRYMSDRKLRRLRIQSWRLAATLRTAMRRRLDDKDRGVKTAGFRVIKWIWCPAVLVEVGFISNPAMERRLAGRHYRQRIAAALSVGIIEYLRRR
jgi:N-acetylmuramoyl-L-alanine amidase